MTVMEMIAKLAQYDGNAEVVVEYNHKVLQKVCVVYRQLLIEDADMVADEIAEGMPVAIYVNGT